MTGFERIYNALSKEKTDHVPYMPKIWVKLACEITRTSIIEVLSDSYKAMEVILEAGKICGLDGVRIFRFPERNIKKDNNGDLYHIGPNGPIGKIDSKGGLSTYLFEDNSINIEDEYTIAFLQFWKQKSPLAVDLKDAKRIAVPDKTFYKELGFDNHILKILNESEGIAIVGNSASPTLSFYSYFRSGAMALMDFYDNPELVHAIMDKGVAIAIEKGKFCIDSGLKILRLNDSTANMNVISPKIFRDFIKPRFKEVCDELHNYNPDVKIYCHNCGNILPVMSDLVETGLDCIAPLDPLGGFSCADARNAVPDDYPLMGGIDTLSFMNSTEQEISAEALACINGAGKNGSFILGSGCVLPPGSIPETIRVAGAVAKSYKY